MLLFAGRQYAKPTPGPFVPTVDPALVASAVAPLPDHTYFDTLAQLLKAEEQVHAASFSASVVTEIWNERVGCWQEIERYEGDVLISADEARAARTTVRRHTQVDPATGRAASESFIEAYAPKAIRRLYTPPFSAPEAVEQPFGYFQSAPLLARDFYTPVMWTDGGGGEIMFPRFGQPLFCDECPISSDARTVDTPLGHHLIDLLSSNLNGGQPTDFSHTFVDPDRNFAFVGDARSLDDRHPHFQSVVDTLVQPMRGFYFPAKAHMLSCSPGEPPTRTTFTAWHVTLNPPTTPADFQLPPTTLPFHMLPRVYPSRQ